jgi:hypothetical protein
MVSPKQIFVIGLLLLGPAFVMFMAGRSEWKRAKQLDAEPEIVTLRQLVEGDVSNRHLFLLTDFRPAESFYYESSEGKTTLEASWVPLYPADEPNDSGAGIRAIAYVPNAASKDELYAKLEQRPLLVQTWKHRARRPQELAKLYPDISVANVFEVSAGAPIPSLRGATEWFLWSGACLAGSLGGLIYTFVFHLDVFGRRTTNASLTLDARPIDSTKIKQSEVQLIESHAEYFLAQGFQSLGCVDSTIMGSRSRIAMFLSPDGHRLLSLNLQKGHANPTLMGIACDGTCLSIGSSRERVNIDGTADGIPLIVNAFPEITDEQIVQGFDVLTQSLPGEGGMAKIDPASALALIHYRMLLKAWWALLNSASHLTPDPLPDRNEIFRTERGVTTFCWGSIGTRPFVGDNAASCDTLLSSGAR